MQIPENLPVLEKKKTLQEEEEEEERLLAELRAKVTFPYLPEKLEGMPEYTLVLDLDETLIHFNMEEEDSKDDGFYMIRPHALKFF